MKNARFCRICLRSLDENCHLLCKITNEGLTAAGHALFLPTKIDSRNEVREDTPTRICKSCYDAVLRVKKNNDDVAAKTKSLKERLAKSRSFFFGTKPQPESSGPMPSRIPTPTRSPSCKRILTERSQRTSARKLTWHVASGPLRRKSLICVSISAINDDIANTAEGEACCLKASQR